MNRDGAVANIANQVAVVIGAGMGGLAAAGALSDFFGRVIVLDRDKLPSEGAPRSGVPQGAHTHGLLLGGLRALQMLFPGIDEDFRAAGAVTIDNGRDVRMERPGFDPFPARTLGIPFCCLSRPAIEFSVRQRVGRLPMSNCAMTAAPRSWSRRRTAAGFTAFAIPRTAARTAP